jgi:hypothetical protein
MSPFVGAPAPMDFYLPCTATEADITLPLRVAENCTTTCPPRMDGMVDNIL